MICVCFVCTSGLVEMPTTIRWSSDVIQCRGHGDHSRSLVVIEEAFYVRPSPEVCDSKCRLGPNATRDECYFHGRACVQLASERDVSALYDSCFPVAAPSACNFTDSGLPDSLWVGYSCVDGKVTPVDFSFLWEVSAFVLKKKKKKVRIILIQFYDLQCQLTQSQLQVLFFIIIFYLSYLYCFDSGFFVVSPSSLFLTASSVEVSVSRAIFQCLHAWAGQE